MFVVTNRQIRSGKKNLDQFGKHPNSRGPHELRIFEAKRSGRSWKATILPDRISREMKAEIGLPASKPAFASNYVAQKIISKVRRQKKNVLFFIHGFNNDVEAVLDRAESLEKLYGVEVIPFSWPANGGGAKGVPSYKSDKRDARASVGAVYRTLAKARHYLDEFNLIQMKEVRKRAFEKHPDNLEEQQAFITRAADHSCPFTVNLMAHSMGNYLLKHLQLSDIYEDHHMLFDNVVLAAADTNNAEHSRWVDRIHCRKRIYITINEDDVALRASRIKSGEKQRARLGHYVHRLDSRQAMYVDVTEATGVGNDHAYFVGDPVKTKSRPLYKFFKDAFNGSRAEDHLKYFDAVNTWRTK